VKTLVSRSWVALLLVACRPAPPASERPESLEETPGDTGSSKPDGSPTDLCLRFAEELLPPHRSDVRELCNAESYDETCVGYSCERTRSRDALECMLANDIDDGVLRRLAFMRNPVTRAYAREGLTRREAWTIPLIEAALTDTEQVEHAGGCQVDRLMLAETAILAAILHPDAREMDAALVDRVHERSKSIEHAYDRDTLRERQEFLARLDQTDTPMADAIDRVLERTGHGRWAGIDVPIRALDATFEDHSLPDAVMVPGGVSCSRHVQRAVQPYEDAERARALELEARAKAAEEAARESEASTDSRSRLEDQKQAVPQPPMKHSASGKKSLMPPGFAIKQFWKHSGLSQPTWHRSSAAQSEFPRHVKSASWQSPPGSTVHCRQASHVGASSHVGSPVSVGSGSPKQVQLARQVCDGAQSASDQHSLSGGQPGSPSSAVASSNVSGPLGSVTVEPAVADPALVGSGVVVGPALVDGRGEPSSFTSPVESSLPPAPRSSPDSGLPTQATASTETRTADRRPIMCTVRPRYHA
jgi:hypothetical protein